jgi:Cys-rich repeat protein
MTQLSGRRGLGRHQDRELHMFAGATVWIPAARWGLRGAVPLLVVLALSPAGCTFDESGLDDKLDCRSSADCGGGAVCIDGTCVERVGCIFNSDCPTGEVCLNATCVAEGDVDVDLGEPNDASNGDAQASDAGDTGAGEPDAAFDTREEPVVDADAATDPDGAADLDAAGDPDVAVDPDVASDPDVAVDPDVATDLDGAADPDMAADPDAVADPDVVTDPDLVADPDVVEEPDLVEEEPEVPLVVVTFDDLPESAEDGTLAEVEDLDNEQFRYSVALGRWVFAWFYDTDPVVQSRMTGTVSPVDEEGSWSIVTDGESASLASNGSEVVFDTRSQGTDLAYARRANGAAVGSSHWVAGEFSVTESIGNGFLRHVVDVRNGEVLVAVNLARDTDGVRIVNGGDRSLGTAFATETAEIPRWVELFVFAGDRADLYVDHLLLQTVPYDDIPAAGSTVYTVGDQRTDGGGLMTVSNATFGSFSP